MKKILFTTIYALFFLYLYLNIDVFLRGGQFPNRPFEKSVRLPKEEYIPGVKGSSTIKINSYGLRGDEYSPENINILTIGNSLSESLYLDDRETWQYQLEQMLNSKGLKVSIYDASVSGARSVQSRVKIIEKYSRLKFDLIIFYPVGTWTPSASFKEGFRVNELSDFSNPNLSIKENILRTRLSDLKHRILGYGTYLNRNSMTDDIFGKNYDKRREIKINARITKWDEETENKKVRLKEKGLIFLFSYLKDHSIKSMVVPKFDLVFLNPTKKQQRLMWGNLAKVGDEYFKYSIEDEKRSLSELNRLIDKVAPKYGIYNIDSDIVNKASADWFYDHHHFNEKGAFRFAQLILPHVEKLLSLRNEK